MSRKGQKAAAAGNKKRGEDEREESLQAIVLADSFETRFNPFTLERPRCLLPLANTPLIEYTLEFLANAGVEDIFIYCGAHTDQVEDYIRNSKWSHASSPFTKLDIIRSTSRSIGDAMRDLDSRNVIAGDFLIVSGDVVSNLPLEAALAKHRARRADDKNAIMTMILREAGASHRTKARGASPVFVVDPSKDRCLHYEEMRPGQADRHVHIDPDLLSSHSEIDVRNDLIDCYIDICTPDVLALWTDSFDYESPRKHFLYGVLKDYELNGKTIHTHIVGDHYAARVRDLQAYDAISKDIVSRWAYPLCPDSNLLLGQSYRFQRGNIYKEDGVVLARSCMVKRHTVIGQGTSIGDGSVISNSIIGRRCQVGRNVKIDGAYVWDDVTIGDGSEIRQAVVANEAVIGSQCTIQPGALISYGVRLANGTKVAGTSRIIRDRRVSSATRGGLDDSVLQPAESDETLVGKGGRGQELVESEDEDDDKFESTASSRLIYNMGNLAISQSSISTLNTDEVSDDGIRPRGESFTSVDDDEFHLTASSSIFEALQRGDGPDIVQIELQGLRMGEDASYHRVRRAIIAAFMMWIMLQVETQGIGVGEAVDKVLRKYRVVFEKTIFDKDSATKVDQVDFLLSLQGELKKREKGENLLLFTSKELYGMDVLEEDGFQQWWQDERSTADAEMRRVRSQTQQFIDWLATAEEESDDEDDDDDEGSQDE
ncbi:MAG: hypothetical protein M1832_003493 [Thelocarpon impressellum]|nr:MAG: hypothetical protein M1832_003493 [Thelocarpon impressellum]